MQALTRIIAIVILATGTTACGGSGSGVNSEPPASSTPPPANDLNWDQGTWDGDDWV